MKDKDKLLSDRTASDVEEPQAPSAHWLMRDVERCAHELYGYALRLLGKRITPVERFELVVRSEAMYDAMDRAEEVVGHRQECRLVVMTYTSQLLGDFHLPVLEMIADERYLMSKYLEVYKHQC